MPFIFPFIHSLDRLTDIRKKLMRGSAWMNYLFALLPDKTMRRVLIGLQLAILLAAGASAQSGLTTGEIAEESLQDSRQIASAYTGAPSQTGTIAGTASDDWLKTFGDADLERIVDEAIQNNSDLSTVKTSLDAAVKLARQADTGLSAAVDVDGGAQAIVHSNTYTSGAALNMQWEHDTWNKLNSTAAATEADLEAARQSLAAQTAKAWFLATETNLQLGLSQEALEIYRQTLEVVEARVTAGNGSAQDIDLASSALNAARARQRQAIDALIQAMRSIEAILGRYPSAELEVVREFMPDLPAVPAAVPASLLERRADLIAAERRVAAAFQQAESSKAVSLPRLSLTVFGGSASASLLDLIGDGGKFFTRGDNFIAPPDPGGMPAARVKIETEQQKAALLNYGSMALRAFIEVESALTNESLLRQGEDIYKASVAGNANLLAAARIEHEVDPSNALSVLQMQARVLNSRISLIRIRNARLAQRVDLHLALGGSFIE